MATITKKELTKQASGISSIIKGILSAGTVSSDAFKSYLTIAAALGALGGAGAGVTSSYVKSKNPELLSLERQKKFYDRKVEEMENENWLNDLMTAKKKLDTSKMSGDDRKDLEKKYLALINR